MSSCLFFAICALVLAGGMDLLAMSSSSSSSQVGDVEFSWLSSSNSDWDFISFIPITILRKTSFALIESSEKKMSVRNGERIACDSSFSSCHPSLVFRDSISSMSAQSMSSLNEGIFFYDDDVLNISFMSILMAQALFPLPDSAK